MKRLILRNAPIRDWGTQKKIRLNSKNNEKTEKEKNSKYSTNQSKISKLAL